MNADSVETVTVAYPGTKTNYFQCDRLLTQSISEIVPRLKVSIESAGFWVLHEIDPQGLLKRGATKFEPRAKSCSFTRALWRACLGPMPRR